MLSLTLYWALLIAWCIGCFFAARYYHQIPKGGFNLFHLIFGTFVGSLMTWIGVFVFKSAELTPGENSIWTFGLFFFLPGISLLFFSARTCVLLFIHSSFNKRGWHIFNTEQWAFALIVLLAFSIYLVVFVRWLLFEVEGVNTYDL